MPRASRINADDSSSAALADSSRGVAGKPTETDGFRFGQTGGQPSRERESLRSGFVDWPRHRTDKPTVATAVSYVARCCIRRSSPILLIPASHSLPPSPPPPPPTRIRSPPSMTAIYYVRFVYPFREGDFQIRHVQDAPISADTCASRLTRLFRPSARFPLDGLERDRETSGESMRPSTREANLSPRRRRIPERPAGITLRGKQKCS